MATPVQLKALLDLSDGVTFNETSADCYDISDIVITANTRRGRSRELDKIESGYAVITVIDENGDFNPDNTSSPYYGKLRPGNKLRLYPEYDDGTGNFRYPDIFTGFVTNYGTRFSMGVNEANQIIIEANDAFKIFNSLSVTNVAGAAAGDTSDERLGEILDEINWPAGLRVFETSALSLADDQGDLRTVLDAMRQVENTEAGLIFVDGSGIVQFKNRTTANEQPNYNDAYKFSDDGIETSYNDLRLTQNDDILINKVTVRSYDGSTEVTVFDSTSEVTYFSRSAERNDVLLTSTTDLTDLAQQLLDNRKDSSLQIDRIILNLAEYEQIDRVIAGLYFDIFFIPLYIVKTLSGNSTINRLGWIQGVNHDITRTTWFVTAFTGLTSPYDAALPNWLTAMYRTPGDSFNVGNQDWVQSKLNLIDFDSNLNSFTAMQVYEDSLDSFPSIAKLDKTGNVLQIIKMSDVYDDGLRSLRTLANDKVAFAYRDADDKGKVIVLNNDLTLNWAKQWAAYSNSWVRVLSDSSNNVYILGGGKISGYAAQVIKFNSTGTLLIGNTILEASETKDFFLTDAVWANNHIYALYNFQYPDFDRLELVKINSSCEIVSQVGFMWDDESYDYWNIVVDENDNKYILGQTNWGNGWSNPHIIKFNASNEIEWDKRYEDGNTEGGYFAPLDVYFASNGELVTLFYRFLYDSNKRFMVLGILGTDGTVAESYKLNNGQNTLYTNGFKVDSTGRIAVPVTYVESGNTDATVINLKPSFSTLGTYSFTTGSDFVYGTYSLAYGTDGNITTTDAVLSWTTDTYTSTSFTPTFVTITSEVLTIEFD